MDKRQIDWRSFLNKLVYCYGCGRFGLPRQGQRPRGWSLLYQPHQEGPPGLHVCSEGCANDVRAAIVKGPVTAPLRMASGVTMPSELRQMMLDEAVQFAIDSGRMDDLFLGALQAERDEGEDDGRDEGGGSDGSD
jgi:hypothetical protein